MNGSLTGRAVEVNWRNLALGHQVFSAGGATFVRNPALPDIYDANFVFGVTASEPAEIDGLLARVAEVYAHAARLTDVGRRGHRWAAEVRRRKEKVVQ